MTKDRFYTKSYYDKDIIVPVKKAFLDLQSMLYGLGFPDTYQNPIFVAGGAITCAYQKQLDSIKDWDFYCINDFVRDKYLTRFNELGVGQHKNLDIMCITDYAVSFKKRNAPRYPYYQIITKYTGTGDDVVSKFDFFHCMAWATRTTVNGHPEFGECAKKKILRCNTYYDREVSGPRLSKFLSRGYRLETEEEKGIRLLQKLGVDPNGNANS